MPKVSLRLKTSRDKNSHYHQEMDRLQLIVKCCIIFVAFILITLTLFYTGTLLLPFQQTDDYDYFASTVHMNYTKAKCSPDFEGYCLNGGSCYHVEAEGTVACICPEQYGGVRCENYLWYT